MAKTVGEVNIKLAFDTKSIPTEQAKVQAQVEKGWSKTGATIANLASTAITKAVGVISNQLSSAISRVDILNNFPTVMTSIGYSAEEAQSSIDSLSDHLDGLPTSLDDAVANVQILAASMGNLNDGTVNATTVAEAFNDAMLAGGQGTEAASAAFTQYSQMLAVGKVDQMSWNNLVRTAPAQMDALAKSLLGAEAGQGQLYKAMQEGTVTFDQFNAALVQLDTEGANGMASFYDQAVQATGGIQTQLDLVKTSLTKVIAAFMTGDDPAKYLEQLTKRIEKVMPTLINTFAGAIPAILQVGVEMLPALLDGINQALPTFLAGIGKLVQSLLAMLPQLMTQIMQSINLIISSIITTLTSPEMLTAILNAGIQLFIAIVQALPQTIQSLSEALPQIIDNIITFLTDPNTISMLLDAAVQLFFALVQAVPMILGSLLSAFGALVGSLWNGITQMFTTFAANFGNFIGDIFRGAINGVLGFIESFINGPIDLLNGFIGIINDNFGAIGVNIGYIDRVNLPRLAQGGLVSSATTALIGEAGQEAVLPLERNTGNWSGLLADTLLDAMAERGGISETGGIIVNQTNYINNEMDAEDIGRRMMTSIRRAAL